MSTKQFNTRLPEHLHVYLDEVSKANGVPKSQVVVSLLQAAKEGRLAILALSPEQRSAVFEEKEQPRPEPTKDANVNLGTGYGSETTMFTRTIEFQTATVDPILIVQVQYATKTKLQSSAFPASGGVRSCSLKPT